MLDRLTPLVETLPGWFLDVVSRLDALFRAALEWLTATASRFGVAIDERTVLGLMVALPIIVLALVLWRRAIVRRRRPHVADTAPPLSRVVRTPRLIGYVALLVFFGGFGSWAALSPLASAAVSPGVVSPDGSRKTVAHLEGGIVHELAVREGDVVHRGQMLMTLEDVQARAEFESLRERFVHLVTLEARLLAELVDDAAIARPASLERFPDEAVAPALLAQQRLLDSRRAAFVGREQILAQRIKQLEAEIAGLEEVIVAQDEQIALISEEIDTVADLLEKGLGGKPRLLALKRARANIRAEQATSRASIARNEQGIGETQIQLLAMHEQLREAVSDELSRVRSELATVKSQLPSREDVLQRTVVAAPLDGTVVNLRVTTESGVVQPGEPLLDLVPVEGALIIDARVKPTDMDTVRTGQSARVMFPAYGQRNLPQITGRLRSISADRLTDERTGEPYFLAKVEVDEVELQRLAPEIELTPGMPAEVMILTGERTMLDYLVRPFIQSVTRSFRES